MNLNANSFSDMYKEMGINIDKLGCIMADLEPIGSKEDYLIDESALYKTKNPDHKWIKGWIASDTSHVTLLYGLMENGHTWKKYVDKVLSGWSLPSVTIDHVGYFDSPYEDDPYYCIVAHLKITPALIEGNQRLQFLPHINTYPDFKAHATVCYIKKDEKLRDQIIARLNGANSLKGKNLRVTGLNYGYKPGEQ